MANQLFPKGAEKMLRGQINFVTDDLRVILITSGYTFSDTHEFLAALGANTVGTAQVVTGKVDTGGIFDAADPDFGALAAGSNVKGLAIYKHTGNPATAPLVAYFDEVTGFPFDTTGGAFTAQWSNGAFKVISLV